MAFAHEEFPAWSRSWVNTPSGRRRWTQLQTNTEMLMSYPRPWSCYICNKPDLKFYHWTQSPREEEDRHDQATIDHVIPRAGGGANSAANMRPCCYPCNAAKGDRMPDGSRASRWPGRARAARSRPAYAVDVVPRVDHPASGGGPRAQRGTRVPQRGGSDGCDASTRISDNGLGVGGPDHNRTACPRHQQLDGGLRADDDVAPPQPRARRLPQVAQRARVPRQAHHAPVDGAAGEVPRPRRP